jgi:hypothetical protein
LKIELRNVKYFAAGSEETSCFTATVYVDGKKAGTAQNHGTGGPTMVHPFTLEKQINDYAATLPQVKLNIGDGKIIEYAQTAEGLIDSIFTHHLIEKDLRKALSKRILYTKKTRRAYSRRRRLPQKNALASSPTLLFTRRDRSTSFSTRSHSTKPSRSTSPRDSKDVQAGVTAPPVLNPPE